MEYPANSYPCKKIADLRVKRKVRVATKRDIAQTRMNTG